MNLFNRIESRTAFLEKSFNVQRRGMALLGAIFPVAFLASSFIFHRTEFQPTISDYYWELDLERNFFVGGLCAVGVFLLLYKGYNWIEDRILDVAGICAVGVAFFPTDKNSDGVTAHGIFAVTFFVCIFIVGILIMPYESEKEDVGDSVRRKKFKKWYNIIAGIMIGCILFAALSRSGSLPAQWVFYNEHAIFFVEAFGVWAFSGIWYIRSRELAPVEAHQKLALASSQTFRP